uniref:Single stranded DNA binding protein n=1 Tax=Podoviridae sp. ctXSp1 TaxID=2825256 RepID=A0A8S5PXW3_9CAUD|nr:MAG TPA: Single stranded DNA binding protein [Podoviridae sp. ctXSp1]
MATDITTTDSPLSGLTTTNGIFTTVKGTDFDSLRKIFSAVNDAKPVSDLNGKPFVIADLVIEATEFVNEKTGEVEPSVRTIFITPDGDAYQAFSGPVFNAAKRLLGLLGEPDSWPEPVKVRVSEEGKGTNRFYKLALA